MRLLLTCVGGEGHAAPLVPIGRAAQARGHDVTFTAAPGLVPLLEATGFAAVPSGPGRRPRPEGITELLPPDQEREDRDLRDRFAGEHAHRRAEDVLALCRELEPEVVVSDEVDFGAMVAAEAAAVPRAVLQVIASGTFLRRDVLAEPLAALRAAHGLPSDPGLTMLERDLVLVPFPRGFRVPDAPWPATAHGVRPTLDGLGPPSGPPPWLTALGDREVVWLSLGTVFNAESGDLFERAVAGLAALDVDLVVTVGRQLDPDVLGPQPAHVHVARHVPQAQLLPRTDVLVSHGGSGSLTAALLQGLPVVLLPLGADQLRNADRCRALAIGRVLDPVTATPADIGEAAMSVLADPASAAVTASLQAELDALPGPDHAVDLLEDLAQDPR